MQRLLVWFEAESRDLPWRSPGTTPWGVLVSEVMLQQTPAARVVDPWTGWMRRWPTPEALAAADSAEVLQAWGRLGYPRRALRLREAAARISLEYDGAVPSETAQLRALPGIGEYTAAAVQAFAFHRPAVVLDVNIRRVLTRVYVGTDLEAGSITNAERALAAAALEEVGRNPEWNGAVMEFGALMCTARNPGCSECPIQDRCRWRQAGCPEPATRRRAQAWKGTDRQVRGIVVQHLRQAEGLAASREELEGLWGDGDQLRGAVQTLLADGLIHRMQDAPGERYGLGSGPASPADRE